MTTAQAEYIRIPALDDNYIWVLHNPASGEVAVVDPGEAAPVLETLGARNLVPTEIVLTHHHDDHIEGMGEVLAMAKEKSGKDIPVTGPAADTHRIAGITNPVKGGDTCKIAGYDAHVLDTPGHTSGHIAFHVPGCMGDYGIAFVGDTMFALGCGRVFEGTMEQMWNSLAAIRALPDNTWIAAGHEYTAGNARYVESLGLDNADTKARIAEVDAMAAKGEPTLPCLLGTEKKASPFLLCDRADVAALFGKEAGAGAEVFAALRTGKDNF